MQLTNNEKYNVYERNNSGMFVGKSYYTVGKFDWTNEFDLSFRKDLAFELCEKLNKEIRFEETCPKCNCELNEKNVTHVKADDSIICFKCGYEFKVNEYNVIVD